MSKINALTSSQKKMLFLSSLGGVLEFYDFIIYIFLSPFIEKVFFSGGSAYLATLKTLAIFAVGYLLRPLGGIIFSHFGDRYGRKVVFLLTVILMAVPSLAIGLLPTTSEMGVVSPILLLIFRMMQGLALGGEIPAAITFVSEHVDQRRLAFANATLFFGINTGLLLGSFVTTVLTSMLTEQEMFSFGWRIPFLLGGIFGVASIFLRRYLHETTAFKALKRQQVAPIPFVTLMRDHWRNVLQGTCLVSIGAVTIFLYLYWPQYLTKYFHYDFSTIMRINTIGTLILNVMILLGGWFSDRIGYHRLYLMIALSIIVFTYPLFLLFNLHSVMWVMVSYTLFSILFGFIPGTYCAMIAMLYPTAVRYSGIAMSYNLAYAFIGGLSPLICTLLIHWFDSLMAPALYLILVACSGFIACIIGMRAASPVVVQQTVLIKKNKFGFSSSQ